MVYDIKNKNLDGIRISKCEAEVLEILIKMNGEPIKKSEIVQEIKQKRSGTPYKENVNTYIFRINKKINGLIKNRHCYGYYIDEEIKIC